MDSVLIAEAMTQDFDSVPVSMPLSDLVAEFERTHHHGFTVLDDTGKLYGVVTLRDMEDALLSESLEGRTVADIATTTGLAVGHPDETMATALWRMGVHGIGRLPVVARSDTQELIGVVRRADVIHAYEQALSQRTEMSYRLKELREAHEGNAVVLETDISADHAFASKTVEEVAQMMPANCILVSVRRGKRVVIPHGDTVLQSGDHVTVLANPDCEGEVRNALRPKAD